MTSVIREIRKQTLALMTAALAFVAGLIWRDAIAKWLAPLYEGQEGAMGLTYAAIVVTVVVVVITIILSKILGEKE